MLQERVLEAPESSPLWMVSQAPALNELVVSLKRARGELEAGTTTRRLVFSRTALARARAEFSAMIRRGERDLHAIAGLLAQELLGEYALRSSAIGEFERTHERFTLTMDVSEDEVMHSTDLDLGTRVLARLAIADQRGWMRALLVSNVVECEPTAPTPLNVYRILTRIKAEEEIWNKVVDELFDLDAIVLRDKQLQHLSRYVKDVVGVLFLSAKHSVSTEGHHADPRAVICHRGTPLLARGCLAGFELFHQQLDLG